MIDCPLAAVLTAGSARFGEPALVRLAAELNAPVRVRVTGSRASTVARALQLAGVRMCPADEDPELEVVAFSSADPSGRPGLAVLDGADRIGFTGAGPMTGAVARCAQVRRRTGVPVVPLSTTAALAALDPAILDDDLFGVLRDLAAGPARPNTEMRTRLMDQLGLFGIANAVTAMRAGADRTAVRTALRQASGVDAVRAEIDRAAAPARYRRVEAALTELGWLAAGPGGARLAGFLAADDVVLARMAVAAAVVRQAGLRAAPGRDPLSVAIGWRRYAEGPVSELHRSCGADLSRGALLLWERRDRPARMPNPPERPVPTARPDPVARVRIAQARIESASAVRTACHTLRAALQAAAADLTSVDDFVGAARRRAARVVAEIDPDMSLPDQPTLQVPALEGRLGTLLGLMFGLGAALTSGRVLAGLVPGWATAMSVGCAVAGLGLGWWVVRARRLLSERAAADRWAADLAAGLRSALEDRVTARILAAEVTLLTSEPFGGCPPP